MSTYIQQSLCLQMNYEEITNFLKNVKGSSIVITYNNNQSDNEKQNSDDDKKSNDGANDKKPKHCMKNYIRSRMAHYNESVKLIFDDEEPPENIKKKNIKGKTMDDVLEELRKEKISYKYAPYFIKKNTKWKCDEKKCKEMKETLEQDFKKLLEYCRKNDTKLSSVNYFLHNRSTAHGFNDILPLLKNMKTTSSMEKYLKHYAVCFSS